MFTIESNQLGVRSIVLGVVGGTAKCSGIVYSDDATGDVGQLIGKPRFLDLDDDGLQGDGWTSFGAASFTDYYGNISLATRGFPEIPSTAQAAFTGVWSTNSCCLNSSG